jgi:hypothetical protein
MAVDLPARQTLAGRRIAVQNHIRAALVAQGLPFLPECGACQKCEAYEW